MSIAGRRLPWNPPLNPRRFERLVYTEKDLSQAIADAARLGDPLIARIGTTMTISRTIEIPASVPSFEVIGDESRGQIRALSGVRVGFSVLNRDFTARDLGFYGAGAVGAPVNFVAINTSAPSPAAPMSFVLNHCKVDAGELIQVATAYGIGTTVRVSDCEFDQSSTTTAAGVSMTLQGCVVSIERNLIKVTSGISYIGSIGVFGLNRVSGAIEFSGDNLSIVGNYVDGTSLTLTATASRCALVGNTGEGGASIVTNGGGNRLVGNNGFDKSINAGDIDMDAISDGSAFFDWTRW